jgi:uncharacterized protein (DUF362 family)
MNRRDFLLSAATICGATAGGLGAVPTSRVVLCRDALLRASLSAKPDPKRLLELLNRGIQALTGRSTAKAAWLDFVKPDDVVGLKVNCLAGRGLSTSVPLVDALIYCLTDAGVPAERIIVWDRHSDDLESAGFRVITDGKRTRYYGNDVGGYESDFCVSGMAASLLSRTLTRTCSVVINLPVLKDHGIAGISIALKNLFGAVHNPNKYHTNAGNPYVADVYAMPAIRSKVRLTICDAITAQYEGGPPFMPQWAWPQNSLIFSTDPVALDSVGWRVIEERRKLAGLKPLSAVGRAPTYIAVAADTAHRLGLNDPTRIETLTVDV